MRKNILAMSLAAAMESMQTIRGELVTKGHKAAGNGFNRRQAKNKSFRPRSNSKYKSHQGKQECARRLRAGSAAWHSRMESKRQNLEVGSND